MHRGLVVVSLVTCLCAALVLGTPPAWAVDGSLPVAGPVVRGFDPPEVRWGSGHRGVDLEAPAGADVRSPADGVVSFVGVVAGRPVVVIDHGDVRSTLEPVEGSVAVGARVGRGDVVGMLVAGHACPAASCLHWGLKRGDEYLDPLSLVTAGQVRLLPDDATAAVRERARQRAAALAALGAGGGALGSGVLARPADGAVTSRFGMRFHPIFHEWRLHAGVDLSAPCGTPIRAAADGVVTHAAYDASGGWRLVIAHGSLGGVDLQTVYLHAQGYSVRVGTTVTRGQVVGSVGSTGWSTGCHLHFSVKADGRQVDPEPWLA